MTPSLGPRLKIVRSSLDGAGAHDVHPEAFRANRRAHAVGFHRRARFRHVVDDRRRPAVREPSAVLVEPRRASAALPRGARQSAVAADRAHRRLRSRSSRGRTAISRRPGMPKRAACRPGTTPSCTCRCSARVVDDLEHTRRHVEALAAKFERGRAAPWVPDYDARRLGGIVGIEIRVDELEGKFKLSQNRSAADRAGVVAQLLGERPRRRCRARATDDGRGAARLGVYSANLRR